MQDCEDFIKVTSTYPLSILDYSCAGDGGLLGPIPDLFVWMVGEHSGHVSSPTSTDTLVHTWGQCRNIYWANVCVFGLLEKNSLPTGLLLVSAPLCFITLILEGRGTPGVIGWTLCRNLHESDVHWQIMWPCMFWSGGHIAWGNLFCWGKLVKLLMYRQRRGATAGTTRNIL